MRPLMWMDGGAVEAEVVLGDGAQLGRVSELAAETVPGSVVAVVVEVGFESVGGVAPQAVAGGAVGDGSEQLDPS